MGDDVFLLHGLIGLLFEPIVCHRLIFARNVFHERQGKVGKLMQARLEDAQECQFFCRYGT